MDKIAVVGIGLIGYEMAWRLVKRKIPVRPVEMRPKTSSSAHYSENFAELVYSNPFRSDSLNNAVGILKKEIRHLDSIIMENAEATRVPAGSALAVDRQTFSRRITEQLKQHPLVEVVQEETTQVPDGPCITASGPLTSDALGKAIQKHTHADYFHFYGAVAPITEEDSIDFSKAYIKSCYDKGEATYINCAMSREGLDAFYEELIHAGTTQLHEFEDETYFEGYMPFEKMAHRGRQTLLFGPTKPIRLERPDETTPYAVVQLRQDNAVASLYNIVGFQTHLKWGGQEHLLSMIPGLENASIVRHSVMRHSSYLCAPKILRPTYQHAQRGDLFFAGQLCGMEGYVKSAASGLLAGTNMANLMREKAIAELPDTCVIGLMAHYIIYASERYFQPMSANFGIMHLSEKVGKKECKKAFANQALSITDIYEKEFD